MKTKQFNTVFVDCFNTIIIRKTKRKDVFIKWAKTLSEIYNIPYKQIYKTYTKVNFNLCFKKLFTSLTLQEKFSVVLKNVYHKLSKKQSHLNETDFINKATEIYVNTELESFTINSKIINMLKEEKQKGKNIYLVSDFYCESEIFKHWFEKLNILHIFNDLFSSCDFDKEKATGKIYKHLIKKLNLNPKNIKMYGDNAWSDVFMARINKLQAQKVKTHRRNNEEK